MSDNEQALAITLGDGRTIYALPGPEDQGQLAHLFGERATIELRPSEADVEGHAVSDDILFDIEGHALTLHMPTRADAAMLRRALVAGAVTATIVGAGAIAALQNPAAQAPAGILPAAAPAPALQDYYQQKANDIDRATEGQAVDSVQAAPSRPAPALQDYYQQKASDIDSATEGQAVDSSANTSGSQSTNPALYNFHLKKVTDAGF